MSSLVRIFDSRYVPGWMVAHRETAALAKRLIAETIEKQGISRDTLTVHADRGSSMTSKPVALLLADLGVRKTHSRPHKSNDTILAQGNPYSEAQFKTLKYRPAFPGRFGSIQDARLFSQEFFDWYNRGHRRSGIGMMTPEAMHHGLAEQVYAFRAEVLEAAYQAHPERFAKGPPRPWQLPQAAWINRPKIHTTTKEVLQ